MSQSARRFQLPVRKLMRWRQRNGVSSDRKRWPGHASHLDVARFLTRRFIGKMFSSPSSPDSNNNDDTNWPLFTCIPYARNQNSVIRDFATPSPHRSPPPSPASSAQTTQTSTTTVKDAAAVVDGVHSKVSLTRGTMRERGSEFSFNPSFEEKTTTEEKVEEKELGSTRIPSKIHFHYANRRDAGATSLSKQYAATVGRLSIDELIASKKKSHIDRKDFAVTTVMDDEVERVHLTLDNLEYSGRNFSTNPQDQQQQQPVVVILANRPSEELYELANRGKENHDEEDAPPPPFIFLGDSRKLDVLRLREGTTVLEYPIELNHSLLWRGMAKTNEMFSFANILGLNPYKTVFKRRSFGGVEDGPQVVEDESQDIDGVSAGNQDGQMKQPVQKAWKYDDGLDQVRKTAGLKLDMRQLRHLDTIHGRRYTAIRLWARDRLVEEFYPENPTAAAPALSSSDSSFKAATMTATEIAQTLPDIYRSDIPPRVAETTNNTARRAWRMLNFNSGKPFYLVHYHPCKPEEVDTNNGDLLEEIPQTLMWLASFPSSSSSSNNNNNNNNNNGDSEITVTARRQSLKIARDPSAPSTASLILDVEPKPGGAIMECTFRISEKAKVGWCLRYLADTLLRNVPGVRVEVLYDDPVGEAEWKKKTTVVRKEPSLSSR